MGTSLRVKICGVRDADSARACAACEADLAGFNLVEGARRRVSPSNIRRLLPLLGATTPVALFRDAPPEQVVATAGELGIEWVQLHGGETPEMCRRLSGELRVIKAIDHDQAHDAARVEAWANHVELFVVDGREPGSGAVWDWTGVASLLEGGRLAGRPVLLAGGLAPENVAQAVAAARPAGVDVASGIERDGRPDPARIAEFVRAARDAAAGRI